MKLIIWMVTGGIVSSLFALIVNTYYTGKLINVGFIKQIKDLLPILGISLLMWFIVLTSLLITPNSYIQLVVGVCIGILFYIVCARMLLKEEWSEVLSMIHTKRENWKVPWHIVENGSHILNISQIVCINIHHKETVRRENISCMDSRSP